MKVILETVTGTQFPVEVGELWALTLQEMKEHVEKTLEIPIAGQILSFNGNILRHDIDLLDVVHESVIKLQVAAEPDPVPAPDQSEAEMMNLRLEISPSQIITVKTCVRDTTVRELKEKIQRKEGTPADYILITTKDGEELPEDGRLIDHTTSLNSGVTVEFLQPRESSSTLSSVNPSSSSPTPAAAVVDVDADADKMILELQFRGNKLPAPVEVRRSGLVKELRPKLEEMKFKAPGNRIIGFFHKQRMLIEEQDFASQNVVHGDIIRIYSQGVSQRNVS